MFVLFSGFAISIEQPKDNFFESVHGPWSLESGKTYVKQRNQLVTDKINDCLEQMTGPPATERKEDMMDLSSKDTKNTKDIVNKFYKSLMDTSADGIKVRAASIKSEFVLIDKMTSKQDIPMILGHLNSIGVDAFISLDETGKVASRKITAFIAPVASHPAAMLPDSIKQIFKTSVGLNLEEKDVEKIRKMIVLETAIADEFRSEGIENDLRRYATFPTDNVPKKLMPWVGYLATAELSGKEKFVQYSEAYFDLLDKKLGLLSSSSFFLQPQA